MGIAMHDDERRSEFSTRAATAAILDRALRFVGTMAFTEPEIVRSAVAREEYVVRYGTAGSTQYREVEIHMKYPDDHMRAMMTPRNRAQRAELERFLNAGVDVLVVCSSTDVIYHEFLGIDLD